MFADEPRQPKAIPLDEMSVDELKERIEELKAEIARCEAEMKKKQDHKAASDALFGGKS